MRSGARVHLIFAVALSLLTAACDQVDGRQEHHASHQSLHDKHATTDTSVAQTETPHRAGGGDADAGQALYATTCTACHGADGHGVPRQGVSLRASKFIAKSSDRDLVAFLKRGRAATESSN